MTAALHAARRLDGQLKAEHVRAALRGLLAAGRPITIAEVARQASVSRKFIYSHPQLRAEIEHRAVQAAAPPRSPLVSEARVTVASLRADVENARAQNQRLRQQLDALERRLSEALGRQIAADLPGDEPPAADAERELRSELAHAQQRAFELEEALAEARDELAAARDINRELLAQHNRPR
jgi:hypothetical protein